MKHVVHATHGGTHTVRVAHITDIGWREGVIFAPLVVLTILFGVAPKPVLDMSAASVTQLLDGYNKAVAKLEAPKTAALKTDLPIVIPVSVPQ